MIIGQKDKNYSRDDENPDLVDDLEILQGKQSGRIGVISCCCDIVEQPCAVKRQCQSNSQGKNNQKAQDHGHDQGKDLQKRRKVTKWRFPEHRLSLIAVKISNFVT